MARSIPKGQPLNDVRGGLHPSSVKGQQETTDPRDGKCADLAMMAL